MKPSFESRAANLILQRISAGENPDNFASRFLSKAHKDLETGCWNWADSKSRGYGRLKINGVFVTAHRISWAYHTRQDPTGLMICNRCDNRGCVNPDHLYVGTDADLLQVKRERGRSGNGGLSGERNPRAKLTEMSVLKIRQRIAAGAYNVDIAKEFGVTHSMISAIRRGKAWGSIKARTGTEQTN